MWLLLVSLLSTLRSCPVQRRPTPAFIYNFAQLTLAASPGSLSAQCPQIAQPVPKCPSPSKSKSKSRSCIFFSSRPSWHCLLHGALLVSRVIYVPPDTRWRWPEPFRLLGPLASPPCCSVPLVSLLILLSVLIHGLRCLRRRNPNKSIFNAMRRTSLLVPLLSPRLSSFPCSSIIAFT